MPDAIRRLGDGYEPHVDEVGASLIYSLPVDSGFVGTSFAFEITGHDLTVLQSDPYRRAALEVSAHSVLQHSMIPGNATVTQAAFDGLVAEVLHGSPAVLTDRVARIDRAYNQSTEYFIGQALARRGAAGSRPS